MQELALLTATEQARLIRTGKASAVEVMEATLARVRALDKRLNAFITVTEESAMEGARRAQEAVHKKAALGPMHGVPVAFKDNFETKGVRTTAGSRVLDRYIPDHDATVVERLCQAGAISIGKTNLSEFAASDMVFGEMRNPWNLKRLAGVSSGGSGAAVAASLCPMAMGHDTGGSIRIPASYSGVVGIKPTYGRVSRYGVLPFAWSLDSAGPLARTVEDAALTLSVIAGHDPKDPTSNTAKVPNYVRALRGGVKGLRIGVHKEWFFDVVEPQVKRGVEAAIRLMETLGAQTKVVSTPTVRYSMEIGPTIMWPEAAAYHEEWLQQCPEKYGPANLGGFRGGKFITATEYLNAQRLRRILRGEFMDALTEVDVVVTPTTPTPARELGVRRPTVLINGKEMPGVYGLAGLTFPFSQVGLPAVSIPCGFTDDGLPIGMQIAGRPFEEGTVLRAAYTYEQHTDWHRMRPPL